MGPLRVAVNFSNYEYNWSGSSLLVDSTDDSSFTEILEITHLSDVTKGSDTSLMFCFIFWDHLALFVSVPSFWQDAINRRLNILCQVSFLNFATTQKSGLPINGRFNIVRFTIILTSSKSNFNYWQFTLHQKCYILSLKQAETPGVVLPMNCPPVPKTNSVRKAFEWHWGQSAGRST